MFKKPNNLFVVVISFLLISGCVTQSINISSNKLPDLENKGLIVGMLTKQGGSNGWIYYKKKGAQDDTRIDATNMWETGLDLHKKKRGTLFAVELEPGEYEMTHWMLYVFNGGQSYTYVSPKHRKPISFQVEKGKAVYLGSYNVVPKSEPGFLGIPRIVSALTEVTNEIERDSEIFRRKYPFLNHIELVDKAPEQSNWDDLETQITH